MKLAAWLLKKKVRRSDFAKQVGISNAYVTALAADAAWPGRDVAQRIWLVTKGAVGPEDFFVEQ